MKELIPREHIDEIRKLLANGESLKKWREMVEQIDAEMPFLAP